MPQSSAASLHYIRDTDGSDQIDFTGMWIAFPEEPERSQPRTVRSTKTIPKWNGSQVVPGRVIRVDLGTHVTDEEVTVIVPLVDIAMRVALEAKYTRNPEPVLWSPNEGTEEWKVQYLDQVFSPKELYPGYWECRIQFGVMEQTIAITS